MTDPIIDITAGHLLFQAVNIIILYLLLRKLLYKPLTSFMAKRRQEIQDDLDSARQSQEEAQRLKEEYARQIQEARQEAKGIMDKALRQSEEIMEKSRQEAKEERDRLLTQAKDEIEIEKQKAFNALRQEFARISVSIAEKIIEQNIDAAAQEKLVNRYLEQMEEVSS